MGSPGLKFNPNEEQLVFHYLRNKNSGIKEKLELIPEADVFKCEPWDLPERSYLPICNNQWHFFSPRDWKYPSGSLGNRATDVGYWRTTRRYKTVHPQSSLTGVGKTLIFYLGRHPHGEKTEWMMNEYHLDEKESETGAGLQNAFVLCHLKKIELTAKGGGMQSAESEKCDSFPQNGNASCDEDKSEDRSQLDLVPPSNNTDFPADIACTGSEATGGYLTGPKSDEYIPQTELLTEIMRQCLNSNPNPSIDEYLEAIITGDYIELNDIENSDSSLSSGSVFNNGGPGIQLRPRSPALDSYQKDVSSEGTSNRRVRLQLHKMDASAGPTETCATSTDIHSASGYMDEDKSDSCGEHKHNSEIENFATGNEVINRIDESSWYQKHEAIYPANFSSVFNSADIPVSHSLPPTFLQPYPVFNVEPSDTTEMSPGTFGTGVNIRLSITARIGKSNMKEHTCFEGCVEESDESSAHSESENPEALLSQEASLDEVSTFGGSLPNSGTLSSVHLEESSALNSSEGNSPALPEEGSKPSSILIRILSSIHGRPASAMELPVDWKSDKKIPALDNTTNSGSLSHPVISDPDTASTLKNSTLKKVSSKGISEYPKLDTASSGLRARSVQKSNIVGGGKDKRREACEHSAGPSSSSVQPRAPSGLFSQLSRRVSLRGSRVRVVLTCLFGLAFLAFLLFLLSSILGIFASTYSAVAF